MPILNFLRLDLDLLEPGFRDMAFKLIANCSERGAEYVAIRGYATYAAQDALYAKGRSVPGPIVTNARGGESAHNFGLAIDFVLDASPAAGVQPAWDKSAYLILVEEAKKLGLHSGEGYGDSPHVSKFGYVTSSDLAPLREAWKSTEKEISTLARLKKVWEGLKP